MLKLHLYARVAAALGASVLVSGSASAASTSNAGNSEFLGFFESIFDNDSNGGNRAAANFDTSSLEEAVHAVSVLGQPEEGEETQFGEPVWAANDGEGDDRRVTGGGDEGEEPIIIEVVELIEHVDLRTTLECDPSRRVCDGGGDGGGAHPVPEPSAGVLFGLGALLVQRRLRR